MPGTQVSIPQLASFTMNALGKEASKAAGGVCKVQVTVLADSSSGSTKFKVVGLTTSAARIWHIGTTFKDGIHALRML